MILGAGFGLFSSPNTNAVMSSVDRRLYGVASGALGTMRTIGQSMSLGIVTLMFAIYIGSTEFVSGAALTAAAQPLFLKSLRVSFVIFTLLCFAGVFASMARGKMREDGKD